LLVGPYPNRTKAGCGMGEFVIKSRNWTPSRVRGKEKGKASKWEEGKTPKNREQGWEGDGWVIPLIDTSPRPGGRGAAQGSCLRDSSPEKGNKGGGVQ